MTNQMYVVFCPRCDRSYGSALSKRDAMGLVKRHVAEQHPDHDPNWAEQLPGEDV